MSKPSKRHPLLNNRALAALVEAKPQLLAGAAGKVPEALVLTTAAAAVQVAGRSAVPGAILSQRALELARETLLQLAQQDWKPDTILLLRKHHGDNRHGSAR